MYPMKKIKLFKNEWPYFKFNEVKLSSKYERWRKVAVILKVSKKAKQRLEWVIYYYEKGEMNVVKTARHFGVSRKIFYKWFRV
jgi:hypothetical protein